MAVKVQKKDGQLEDFDRSKVSSGIVKSGTAPEEANNIVVQVEAWAQSAAVDGVINSSVIRGKVLELLQTANPVAAAKFEAFKKTV